MPRVPGCEFNLPFIVGDISLSSTLVPRVHRLQHRAGPGALGEDLLKERQMSRILKAAMKANAK